MMISRLTLGTAQLGLNYGVNNRTGKPLREQALSILESAFLNNINSFDTASVYGNSENIIGDFLDNKKRSKYYITSKLEALTKNNVSHNDLEDNIFKKIEKSLQNLKVDYIDNYLIHDFEDIINYKELIPILSKAKEEEEIIKNIGVSVYAPSEAEIIMDINDFDTIQVPLNILDQRFLQNSLLERLKEKNFTIFSRSVFLQGLLFMDPNNLPVNLLPASDAIININQIAKINNVEITQLALNFIKSIKEIDSVLIGVDSKQQLIQNINDFNIENYPDIDYSIFENKNENIVDPRKW